jgi:nicotinate-nucleotide--dimethylbenzimidazole phosphoribosyltransferase
MGLTLVIGGTRSGKSARAESLAAAAGLPVRYVGTADPADGSMAERIAAHRIRRPTTWETRHADDGLAATVTPGTLTLIDGLGAWIAGRDPATVHTQVAELIDASQRAEAEVIVVAEHAGEGLLPMDAVARDWLDLLGESVQRLSAVAARAELVVAGRVLELPPPEPFSAPPPPVELPAAAAPSAAAPSTAPPLP